MQRIIAISLVLLAACSDGPEDQARVSYRVSAKENFLKGKEAFEDENYLEAIEFFRFVKNKFPYSTYASDSDLYIADSQFAREKYVEAVEAYTEFMKLHPKNPKVGYASFRIALSYHHRMPSDVFIFPPAFELDQKDTFRAVRELERYIEAFPKDENVPEAQKLLFECKTRLAQSVHFVMRFNRKNGKSRGALWRAQELLKNYPGTGFDEEALFVKAESEAALGDVEGSRATLAELSKRFPDGVYAGDARTLAGRLEGPSPQGGPAK